jgi:polyphosphate kinase
MTTASTAERPAGFLGRDLSWLAFNARVLPEALDPRAPLLERVKFLAIFGSNLDEFFMKRLGRLQRLLELGDADAGRRLVRPAIRLLDWADLTAPHRGAATAYFRRNLYPF